MKCIPWVSIILGFSALALGLGASDELFQVLVYDRHQLIDGEWWRLITGHLLHWNNSHLWWDVLVCVCLGSICDWIDVKRHLVMCLVSFLFISISMLMFMPELHFYAGLSGLASAQFVAISLVAIRSKDLVLRLTGAIAVLLFVAKVVWECWLGTSLFASTSLHPPVPLAHCCGALCGLIFVIPKFYILPFRSRKRCLSQ